MLFTVATWLERSCVADLLRLSLPSMFRLFAHPRRLFLHCTAVAVALMVMLTSWCPPGWMVCLHHDGELHVVSCIAHDQLHDDAHEHEDACCEHNDCIDVVIDVPEANRFAPVIAPLAASVPVTIHWLPYCDGLSLVVVNGCSVKLLRHSRRQFDFGPPTACPIRTFRTLSLQV